MKNGATTAQAWQTHMTGCTVAAKQQVKQCLINKRNLSELTTSLQNTTLSAQAAEMGLKALSIAGNMLLMFGITQGISLVAKSISKLNDDYAQLKNSISELNNEYNRQTQRIDEINNKLEDNKEKIQEIQKLKNPTYVDLQDLEKLQTQNALLKEQLELYQKAKEATSKKRLEKTKEEIYKTFYTNEAELEEKTRLDSPEKWIYTITTAGVYNAYKSSKISNKDTQYENVQKTIEALERLNELKKEAEENNGSVIAGDLSTDRLSLFYWIKKGIFTGKSVTSEQIDSIIASYSDSLQSYSTLVLSLLDKLAEDDPYYEDGESKFLLYLNEQLTKYLDFKTYVNGIINKTAADNKYNDISEKIKDSISKGIIKSENDLLSDEDANRFVKYVSKTIYDGASDDESMKKAASYIIINFSEELDIADKNKETISIKESLDTLISSASSLSSALTTLYSGDYNSSDLLSSIMTINSAISQFGDDVSVDWENITSLDQLQDVIMELSETYAKSILSDAGISTKNNPFAEMIQNSIAESIKLKAQLDGVNNALDSLQGNYKALTDTIDTYNQYGYITIDQLQSLLAMDYKYLSCLTDENGQLNLNKSAYANLTKMQLENARATALTEYEAEIARIKQDALTRANQNLGTSIGASISTSIGTQNSGLIGKLNALSGRFTILSGVMSVAKNIFGKFKNVIDEQKSKLQIDTDNVILDKQAEEELKAAEQAYNTRLNLINSVSDNINNSMDRIMGNSDSGSDSPSSSTTIFDWIEIKINNLTDALNRLKDASDDTYSSWTDRSNALVNAINTTRQAIDLQQQAYDRYMQEAEKSGLPDVYKELVKNGAIDIFDTENDDLKEQISDYQNWYDKAKNCLDVQKDLIDSLNELNSKKFDNIQSIFDFDNSNIEHSLTMLNSQIDKLEMKGLFANESYYNQMLQYTQKEISSLTNERKQLADIMNSSALSHDSEAWQNMYSTLSEIDEQISDLNKDLIEFNNNIRDLNWEIFEYLEDLITRITDETDYLINLLKDKDLFDDNGNFNKYADATVGLHAAAYDTYKQQAQDYLEEMHDLQKQLVNGSGKDVLEQYNKMVDAHRDAINSANDEKQSILDLIEDGYNAQLDALQKLIDKKKEQMNAEKNLYDYQKTIKEKTDNISSLEKQKFAYGDDDSEEAISKIQQIKVQLEEAKADLKETEYEQYLSDTENMLDKLSADYEEWMNARLDNEDALLSEIIGTVAGKSDEIKATLNEVADEYGTKISDSITSVFNAASPFTAALTNGLNNVSNSIAGTTAAIDRLIAQVAGITNANAGKTNAGSETSGKVNVNYNSSSGGLSSNIKTGSTGYSSGSDNNSANSSTANDAEKIFIHKTDTYPKNKLNIETSIVDRLKYYNFDSSFAARTSYYSKLGGSGTYTGSAAQNTWLIQKMKSMGYKKGTKNASAGLHWTQEDGEEIIIRKSDGAVLTQLNKGDLVLDNESSQTLWEFSQDPGAFMKKFGFSNLTPQISVAAPIIPAMVGVNGSTPLNMNVGDIEINLPNVKNYDEFKNQLIKDSNFEKAMFSAINHAATGKGNVFDKMKYTR